MSDTVLFRIFIKLGSGALAPPFDEAKAKSIKHDKGHAL